MFAPGQPGHSSKRKLVIMQSLCCITDQQEVNRSSFSSPHTVLRAARLIPCEEEEEEEGKEPTSLSLL